MSHHTHDHEVPPGASVTTPLREEHRELLPSIEALANAADSIGDAPLAEQRERVEAAHAFLSEELIPHATAEDQVLYGKVDQLIGSRGATGATDTMRRDHAEVGRLTARLGELRAKLDEGELSSPEERELRRVLYGLHTLVGVHFAKEEEVYLPLLDRELAPEEARALFAEMERVKSVSSASGQAPSGSPSQAQERH
ncbi:MAG TPA: hemerythrin domain-containing protein [Solirubrobacterales bacterium]